MMKKKKRLTAIFSALLLMLGGTWTVWGAAVDLNAVYEIATNKVEGWPKGPELYSDTGVLMEAETGMLVYSKGADELRYPASITKLMTLLVAVENSSLTDTVTFTETGIRDITWDSGNIGMQLGEQLTMEQCLYAMIIYSANEVSAQIAEFVGGTEQNFIDMMNERAREIGCTNTHFANASGLPDPDQYTTARDMALIFREGIKNPVYREILNTPTYEIPPTNKNSETRMLHTHHPLFAQEAPQHYEGCFGGKSGMTTEAGNTLVTGVEQNGVTYIAVVMRASELRFSCVDSIALFDYAYQNFEKISYRNGRIVLPVDADVNSVSVQALGEGKYEDYFFSNYLIGKGVRPDPTATPIPTPTHLPTSLPDDVETEGGTVVEEAGDAEDEPLYQDEAEEGEEWSLPGFSHMASILLIAGAVMLLFLLALIVALIRKNSRRRRRRRR